MTAYQPLDPFRPYLSPGETILWSGRPKQGLALGKSDVLLIPFSLMWGGFAIFWNIGVWSFPKTGEDVDWFLRLWGLPFLLVGLYLIAGRFFYDAWIRKTSCYAVTNQRVLILRRSPTPKLTSREIRSLPMFEVSEHRDGTGTIDFDSDQVGYSMFGRRRGFSAWAPAASANAQFFRVENPRRVYEVVRRQYQS